MQVIFYYTNFLCISQPFIISPGFSRRNASGPIPIRYRPQRSHENIKRESKWVKGQWQHPPPWEWPPEQEQPPEQPEQPPFFLSLMTLRTASTTAMTSTKTMRMVGKFITETAFPRSGFPYALTAARRSLASALGCGRNSRYRKATRMMIATTVPTPNEAAPVSSAPN